MASFQVEMAAASSSPFGCVLRDRNRCSNRETTTAASTAASAASTATNTSSSKAAAAAFQKNLKVLVRDHLHTCISVSPDENSNHNENLAENSTRTASSKPESTRNNNNNNNNNSSNSRMSSRQARNLDRWAAKQAEQMVSTIERQRQEAEELWVVASSNPSNSSSNPKKDTENRVISSQSSIADSECSSQIGASSLVQIWEARMNHPKLKPLHSRSSSISSLDNLTEEPARHSDVCLDTVSNNDLLTDWVDSAAQSTVSAPVANRHSDVGADGEKVRIADIIRRLTCDVHEQHNHQNHHNYQHHDPYVHCDTPRRHSISCEPPEHRGGWSLVVSSPRIRGRQAFHDLLVHIEQDRHRELGSLAERHAVSKFSYRGRIQSLLKLRFLRRDMGAQSRPVPPPPACRPPQHSSSIMQLRERLRASLQQAISSERETVVAAPTRLENHSRKVDSNTQNQLASESQPKGKVPPLVDQCPVVVAANVEQQSQQVKQEKQRAEVVSVSPPVLDKKETGERVEDVARNHVEEQFNDPEAEENTVAETSETYDLPLPENMPFQDSVDAWQERYLDCAIGDEAEPEEEGEGEGDEEECDEEEEQQDYAEEEAPYDWFSDIARPRSYWEDMRRSWYNEMLNDGGGNRDIKELLERKTVSSFLSSDFRDRIDRLMLSRARIQTQEQPESDVEENQERMAQLALSYFRRENNDGSSQEQHPMVDDDRGEIEETDEGTEEGESSSSSSSKSSEEEDESEQYMDQEEHHRAESLTSRQFVEANDLFDRASHQSSIFTASPFRPWQSVEEYERFSNANSQQHHQSFQGSHNQERKCSCCAIHASIDVDVVNELRGNVAELRSEVAELKKLVQSYMEMQMSLAKLQQQQPGEVGTWMNPPTRFQ